MEPDESPRPKARPLSRFALLRERDFRLLFLSQSASLIGDAMVPIAVSFAVLELGGSATSVGLVLAARFAPTVALVLAGGVLGDRMRRRVLMITADLARFVSQAVLAALLVSGHAEIWHIGALQAIQGGATAFFAPAAMGLLPEVVVAPRLQEANALRGFASSSSEIAGPAIAGALVASVGPGWAIAVDALTFLISAVLLAGLQAPRADRALKSTFLADLVLGWREFRARRWLWLTVLWSALHNMLVAAPFIVLGVVVADQDLDGAGSWAFILSASGAGALVGGALALRVRPRRPLRVGLIGMVISALPSVLLALTAPTVVIALASFSAGIAFSFFVVLWDTTLQSKIPRDSLSRVSSYDWFAGLAGYPIGQALAGPLAGAIGTHEALALSGLYAVVSIAAVLSVGSVRDLRADFETSRAY